MFPSCALCFFFSCAETATKLCLLAQFHLYLSKFRDDFSVEKGHRQLFLRFLLCFFKLLQILDALVVRSAIPLVSDRCIAVVR